MLHFMLLMIKEYGYLFYIHYIFKSEILQTIHLIKLISSQVLFSHCENIQRIIFTMRK